METPGQELDDDLEKGLGDQLAPDYPADMKPSELHPA